MLSAASIIFNLSVCLQCLSLIHITSGDVIWAHNPLCQQQAVVQCAGESANATYGNFTQDRIFKSPTDINWVIGRVLVLNDSDLPTAYTYSKSYTITAYNAAGMSEALLQLASHTFYCLLHAMEAAAP